MPTTYTEMLANAKEDLATLARQLLESRSIAGRSVIQRKIDDQTRLIEWLEPKASKESSPTSHAPYVVKFQRPS